MQSKQPYPEEFKVEAVKQVRERTLRPCVTTTRGRGSGDAEESESRGVASVLPRPSTVPDAFRSTWPARRPFLRARSLVEGTAGEGLAWLDSGVAGVFNELFADP